MVRIMWNVELIDSNPLYSSCHVKNDTKTRPKGTIRDVRILESLQRLERLESLQSLQRLERLQSMKRLEIPLIDSYSMDYQSVPIPDGAVVYCDPPYKGTGGYGKDKKASFDYERFYEWCLSRDYPVFVSEYQMPDGFSEIASTVRADSMSATATVKRVEKLFVQGRFAERYKRKTLFDGQD